MENICEHISYAEAVKSNTAIKLGLQNIPDLMQLQNMKNLGRFLFEPLRDWLGNKPIFVSSFFRSKQLNKELHGADDSQHMANWGSAIDLDNDGFPNWPDNANIFYALLNMGGFDQLIWEFGNSPYEEYIHKPKPAWVHVSYVSERENRGQIFVSRRVYNQDKDKYETKYYTFRNAA